MANFRTPLTQPNFGWLYPPEEKVAYCLDNWALDGVGLQVPDVVEVELPGVESANLVLAYNQGKTSGCVGFSHSWCQTINNTLERGRTTVYDAVWLYHQAQLNDGDPRTNPKNDNGTYVWAAMDVLRKQGHRIHGQATPSRMEGIDNYYWVKSVDDIRTAFSLKRPVVFGIPWYQSFSDPYIKDGERWIGDKASWGRVLGGHAICSWSCSDKRQAVRWVNTWGTVYPPVWISYSAIERLLKEPHEIAVPIDMIDLPQPPPNPDLSIDITLKTPDGRTFAGTLKEVK